MKLLIITLSLFLNSFISNAQVKDSIQDIGAGFFIISLDSNNYTIGKMADGKKVGSWVYYSGNKVRKIALFKNNQLSGVTIVFNEHNKIVKEIAFENGKVNGKVKFYSSSGELLAIYGYINNVLTTFEYYVPNDESPPYKRDFIPDY
jgi:hypothetical protein